MPDLDEQLAASDFVPAQDDLEFPLPPTFDSVDDERRHRKERLAGALRLFAKLGLAEGAAGHITVRDPELLDHFWVNPFGMNFKHVSVSDLILIDHQGQVVHGSKPVNAAAFAIHGAIHAARPDVIAAAHSHSVHGKAWSALGRELPMHTQDHCMFYGHHAVHTDSGGAVVTGADEAKGLTHSLGKGKALIHQNHGLITVGESVDEAAWWFIALDRCCQASLLAEAAGEPRIIPDEYARYSFEQTGYSFAGWFQFQGLWDEISQDQPDLFD